MSVSTANPSNVPQNAVRGRLGLLRAGLVISAVLAAGDVALSLGQIAGSDPFAVGMSVVVVAAAIATLVLVPFAWHGRRGPSVAIVVLRLAAALTALPAFVVPGVPAPFVALAAGGILIAATAATLILLGMRRRS